MYYVLTSLLNFKVQFLKKGPPLNDTNDNFIFLRKIAKVQLIYQEIDFEFKYIYMYMYINISFPDLTRVEATGLVN